MNLNRLLDNDQLYPSQERFIRKMISYRLEIDNSKEKITVFYKKDPKATTEGRINIFLNDFDNSKLNALKYVMYENLMNKYEGELIKDKDLEKESGDVLDRNYGRYLTDSIIKEDARKLFELLIRINKVADHA